MVSPPAPRPDPPQHLSAGRIVLIVAGSLLALLGVGLAAAGGGLAIAHGVLRDSDGFFTTSTEPFATSGRAITTEKLSVLEGGRHELADANLATVRIRAQSDDRSKPVFIGIARTSDVDRYLAGVDHAQIRSVDYSPFRVDYAERDGASAPALPTGQTFWAARATGPGQQTLQWRVDSGTWSVVIMNADASPGVAVSASAGAKIRHLLAIALSILAAGVVILAGAVLMIVLASRTPPDAGAPAADSLPVGASSGAVVGATPTMPVVLTGALDATPSRWLWLVKWVLAIPHWIILAVLWIVFFVLSVCAFFAILVTGRYPRGIFEFNVGVLRWTWRVSFYSYSALGTDRYPPFSLHDVPDYPARVDIAYPERLSRGLVLVKWWLLAIPHLIIVALFTGGWASGAPGTWVFADGNDGWWQGSPGLIGVLVLIAAIAVLFTGRYPQGVFDLVMGLNRWAYRVIAYVGLMRDEYPPFRLDLGGEEPGAQPRTIGDAPFPPSHDPQRPVHR